MTKFRLNKALFLFLITAFLTAQWTSAHIHLAQHHDHDSGHHQHAAQAHTHHLADHHGDVIDAASEAVVHHAVDLDHECNSSGWKKSGKHYALCIARTLPFSSSLQAIDVELAEFTAAKQNYLTYSTIRLRAPPQTV